MCEQHEARIRLKDGSLNESEMFPVSIESVGDYDGTPSQKAERMSELSNIESDTA